MPRASWLRRRVILIKPRAAPYIGRLKSRLFQRGYDALDSFYDLGRGDGPCGHPSCGSTLRFTLPHLPTEVGVGRQYRHRLQLYIMGAVTRDGFRALGHVLGQPVASTSGVAESLNWTTRPCLIGHRDHSFRSREVEVVWQFRRAYEAVCSESSWPRDKSTTA